MSKAILVIDMPDSCRECKISVVDGNGAHPLSYNRKCPILNRYLSFEVLSKKQNDCPLKEAPEYREIVNNYDDKLNGIDEGWNDCLDEILGG